MKKYGKYEFEKDSKFDELYLQIELYGSRLKEIAFAEQDLQDATNEDERQSAKIY